MGRPRKYYVVWFDDGRPPAVITGYDAAKAESASYKAFSTELAAQEYAAWWAYRHGRPRYALK